MFTGNPHPRISAMKFPLSQWDKGTLEAQQSGKG